jgi:hypothetical protein
MSGLSLARLLYPDLTAHISHVIMQLPRILRLRELLRLVRQTVNEYQVHQTSYLSQ